ncbi:WPP domain-associated protein isoform X2 [Rhodamnia argentea]|uniref:WPP domain-associated protein isoform X2 n=1 Tax=Rhodamnia argentea TaxID=178133 RepID=A0ABM3H5Z3_9MYRT|nr:WPP domain-associated protein isoform X2 [Rhodamnia argentea]
MKEHCNLDSFRVTDNGAISCSDRPLNHLSNGRESENLDVELLSDLESYWQDINDRLTISRMVSDSVIKGMVSAVEQEAEEKIAEKRLEIAGLKETLRAYCTVEDRVKLSHIPLSLLNEGNTQQDSFSVISNPHEDHDKNLDFLRSFISEVKEQLAKLQKEVNNVKGGNCCRRINSGGELVGLGSILLEEVSERLIGVDSTFGGLQSTLDSFFSQLKDMVHIREMQQEWELTAEIEAIVITEYIRSLHSEFERKLWDLNSYSSSCENLSSLKKLKEITALREELVMLSNLLSSNDNGQLVSQVSLEDGEECLINKKSDNLIRKLSGNHLPSASPWEGSGKHDERIISMPENLDPAQLKHMPRDELISYFKSEMTKMKRYYESKVQEKTEEVFTLKREYLKERGSSSTVRKDKEFEGLKRKIPEVVLKLDDILMETNSVPQSNGDAGSLGTLRERLEDLLAENHRLRGILSDKKKEVKCLLSQLSDDAKQISSHSSAEAKLLEVIRNLTCKQEDAQVEASISEEVYKCTIKEMMAHMQHISGNLYNQKSIREDVHEIAHVADCSCQSEFENLNMDSVMLQGLDNLIFAEVLKDAKEKLCHLNDSYINEMKLRVSLELEAMERERSLASKISENEKLKQEMTQLAVLVEEKEKLAQGTASELSIQMKHCEIISQELDQLRAESSRQQTLIAEMNEKSELMKGNLAQGLEQIKTYETEFNNLNEKLSLAVKEKENGLQLLRVKERENLKQLESTTGTIHELLKKVADLEQCISEDIQRKNMRLGTVESQLSSLKQKAVALGRMGSIYKQRLERRCSDLQKAEAEVDLLGDQADTLLNLLEKVYIGLDHYSPILQHYPGIMEVLKLVKRELTGESLKLI